MTSHEGTQMQAAKRTAREPAELQMHRPAFVRNRHRRGIQVHEGLSADGLPDLNPVHASPSFLIIFCARNTGLRTTFRRPAVQN
jgi:hypothetical protein